MINSSASCQPSSILPESPCKLTRLYNPWSLRTSGRTTTESRKVRLRACSNMAPHSFSLIGTFAHAFCYGQKLVDRYKVLQDSVLFLQQQANKATFVEIFIMHSLFPGIHSKQPSSLDCNISTKIYWGGGQNVFWGETGYMDFVLHMHVEKQNIPRLYFHPTDFDEDNFRVSILCSEWQVYFNVQFMIHQCSKINNLCREQGTYFPSLHQLNRSFSALASLVYKWVSPNSQK